MPSIRKLQAFKAVMETRSISRAAEAMFLTQPAVSKLIQSLEIELGLCLFDRQRRRLVPTAEAHLYLIEAENLFLNMTRLDRFAHDLKAMVHTSMTVACYPALAIDMMPEIMTSFRQRHPGTTLNLLIRSTPLLGDMAIAQQFDVGISMLPVIHPDVISIPCLRENFMVLMPGNHRLAERKVLGPKDLEYEDFVSMGLDDRLGFLVDEYFLDAGVQRRIVGRVALSSAICGFVRAGAGVSLVGPLTALGTNAHGLASALLRPKLTYDAHLLVPKHRPTSATREQFLVHLHESFAQPYPEFQQLPWKPAPIRSLMSSPPKREKSAAPSSRATMPGQKSPDMSREK
ncbi:MAG: LysR family transcriptional regulator [Paracoccus sp. (in: a-proteobacteria)]|nr:LysR family transcriptional regulator [Paracoccus sp. (in: a-proteobacteria)]